MSHGGDELGMGGKRIPLSCDLKQSPGLDLDAADNLGIELFQPAGGDIANTVSRARQHAGKRPGSVGVVALVHHLGDAGWV